MKICKICNNEITHKKRRVYCSDECLKESKKILNKQKIKITSEKYKKQKETWKHEIIELSKIKHNSKIPINQLGLSVAVSTHLKQMLRENNLSIKKTIKFRRIDGALKEFLVVVVTPQMIKFLFDKKYELYKSNFRLDCLRTVKYLAKTFDIANDWKKDTNSNTK